MFGARAFLALRMFQLAEEEERKPRSGPRYVKKSRDIFQINRISEKKFVEQYRISKRAFNYLCEVLKKNTDLRKSQRVSLETKILSALLFYANGNYQRDIGAVHDLSQEAISRFVQEVTEALNHPNMINKFIKFPSSEGDRNSLSQSFCNTFGFPGVVGCIGGSQFRIIKPKKDEQHLFLCREHYHSLNVQVVSDHQGRILYVNPKFGGASHNALVFENSFLDTFMQNLHDNGETVWLLGDSEYPLRPWLMTPYLNPIPGSIQDIYNIIHSKTRDIIEKTFSCLKNRWRCLSKNRVLHYKPEKCAKIIIACSILHNIALDFKVSLTDQMPENDEPSISQHFEEDEETSILDLGRQMRDKLASKLYAAATE